MDVTVSLLAIVVLLILLLIVRRALRPKVNQRPAIKRPAAGSSDAAFHAVSIQFASNACTAAKEMQGRRFLSSAAPKIPLPDCDVSQCQCRFVHHDDRRSGDERRNPWSPAVSGETGTYRQEQRQGGDRRHSGK